MRHNWFWCMAVMGVLQGGEVLWNDDFSHYSSPEEMSRVWDPAGEHRLRLDDRGLRLFSNGQAAVRRLQGAWLPGRDIEMEFSVILDNDRTEARILFSHGKLDWMNYQGGVLLKAGMLPMYCDSGVWKQAKLKPVAIGTEYVVRCVLHPSLTGASSYDIAVNGGEIGRKLPFREDLRRQPADCAGVICLGGAAEPLSMSLKRAQARYGMRYEVDDKEKVQVSLGKIPHGGRRFYDNRMEFPVRFSGDLKLITEVSAALYPNRRNHPDQAEESPVAVAVLKRNPGPEERFRLESVPYGMHTLRISCVINGKRHVVAEELVSMIHREVKRDEHNWFGLISHADRFDRNIPLELDNVAAAGGSWTRMEFILAELYRDGKLDFSHHRRLFEEGKRRGIRFFGLLNTTPPGCSLMPGDGYWAQPNLDRWREMCAAVMTEFKGKIDHWEIWNEPDGFAFWGFSPGVSRAEHHAKMVNIAAEVAASISPKIRVMRPSVTATGEAYFQEFLEAGGLDRIDTITFHFPAGRSPGEWYRRVARQLRERYPEREFKFWISECEFYLQNLIAMLAEERPLPRFLYTIRDKGVGRDVFEHENGMCKYNGQPKDKFVAYQFLVRMLAGAEPAGRILFAENLEGYRFRKEGRWIAAVWSPGTSPIQPIPAGYLKGVTIYDQNGNRIPNTGAPIVAKKGEHENQVIYLDRIPEDSPLNLDASVNCSADYGELAAGRETELRFSFTNDGAAPCRYRLVFSPDPLLTLSEGELEVEVMPGRTQERSVSATPAADIAVTELTLSAQLFRGGHSVKKRFGPFLIDNPRQFAWQELYRYRKGVNWVLPEECRDIHGDSIFEDRAKVNQHRHSLGSGCKAVSAPSGRGLELQYCWRRPVSGWNWMARRYAPLEKILLKGIPTQFEMDVQLPQSGELLPLTVLLILEDASGKELLVEGGGELYWFHDRVRKWRCVIPSRFGTGFIHSAHGGDGKRNITRYPLYFNGLILNLVPAQFVWQFREDRPSVEGKVMINNLRVQYFNGRK